MTHSHRVSRSQAQTRMRQQRLSAQAAHFEERSSTVLKVAAEVAENAVQTRDALRDMREGRAARAGDQRDALSAFRQDLATDMAGAMDAARAARAQRASDDQAARAQFMSGLRADVERIVTEDFGLGTASSGDFAMEDNSMDEADPDAELAA